MSRQLPLFDPQKRRGAAAVSHNRRRGKRAALSQRVLSIFKGGCVFALIQNGILMSFLGFWEKSKGPFGLPGILGLRYPQDQAGRQNFSRNSASWRCPGSHSFQESEREREGRGAVVQMSLPPRPRLASSCNRLTCRPAHQTSLNVIACSIRWMINPPNTRVWFVHVLLWQQQQQSPILVPSGELESQLPI